MKVLIAIDDSKFSQAAIDTFIAQANPKETEVRFLHVLEPIYTHGQTLGYFPDASRILAEESENAKALLARASQKLGDEGFTVTTALEVGNPKVVIIDSAAEWHADLIVVGSHGRKGLDHFLLGSVSEAVARHASCSVQIVRVPTEVPTHLAVSSNKSGKDVGNPKGKIQTPIALESEQHKQFCKVCGKPSSSNICPVCADKIRAEAVARKKREDKGEE
jgi:nucleotide-binding universal stress UspA family protein